MEDLEKLLMTRFNDIITALTIKFADKAETKKTFKLLERQIKNLYDLLTNKADNSRIDEPIAMFAKTGYTCASCERNIINL